MKYTQEQLEQQTDFDLSAVILCLRHGDDVPTFRDLDGDSIDCACADVTLGYEDCIIKFDINNWSDIGLLIEDCGISWDVYKDTMRGFDGFVAAQHIQAYSAGISTINSKSTNLKRAIAIVYLLIKQGE